VAIEMDLRLEAAALSEMAETTAGDPGFRIPKVEWELTARDVLTLEWIDCIKLSDVEKLRKAGHDLPALARRLIQSFLRHALRDGFFHADMHQGNLFVDKAGDIVAVDFGIMGRLGRAEQRFLAEILFASSAATTGVSPRCISRRAMSPPSATRSTTSPRRSAQLASRSTGSVRGTSPWRGSCRFSLR
jgi:predicted unusual protein kinase regulating ubiquinone biosynthesis (AarF/ABC1/UbiB family)